MEVAAAVKKASPALPFPVTGILSGNSFRRPEGQARRAGIRAIEFKNIRLIDRHRKRISKADVVSKESCPLESARRGGASCEAVNSARISFLGLPLKIMPLQATPNHKVKQPAKDQWAKNDAHACKKPFDLMQSDFVFRLRGDDKVNHEKRCSGYQRNKICVN